MYRLSLIAAILIATLPFQANSATPVGTQLEPVQQEAAKAVPLDKNGIQVQGVPGADISEYDDPLDLPQLALVKQFIILRASHGLHHDAIYTAMYAQGKQLGVVVGAYHFVVPTEDFAEQLRYFVKTVRLQKGDLYPILDLEKPESWKNMPQPDRIKYILKWAHALEHIYGVKPIIYLSPSFVQDVIGLQEALALKDYPLWVAHYNVAYPWVPVPWTSFIIWQWVDKGTCPGIKGPCDEDVAPGTLADLKKFTMDHDAGGDDTLLTAADLDDGGLTVKTAVHDEDDQHGRAPHPRHWHANVKHRHPIATHHRRRSRHGGDDD
jgi:GH25 family lysozyme M1 (1,4-beta-N-acetylmuramidase)